MELKKQHKYQKGTYHCIQLYGGSAVPIYIILEKDKFITAFTRKDEAEEYINKTRFELYKKLKVVPTRLKYEDYYKNNR
ncbi:hypothetical protein LCGC14_1045490 [marine sediment metagenome]|uniref:Uncharacterized protein n=1 Tax=marine sediment metagenome TaxID=412755 RepID=A0A0F9MUW6_9ZZZZ